MLPWYLKSLHSQKMSTISFNCVFFLKHLSFLAQNCLPTWNSASRRIQFQLSYTEISCWYLLGNNQQPIGISKSRFKNLLTVLDHCIMILSKDILRCVTQIDESICSSNCKFVNPFSSFTKFLKAFFMWIFEQSMSCLENLFCWKVCQKLWLQLYWYVWVTLSEYWYDRVEPSCT